MSKLITKYKKPMQAAKQEVLKIIGRMPEDRDKIQAKTNNFERLG